jgi:F-type H+-transporting ATPase subunit delta
MNFFRPMTPATAGETRPPAAILPRSMAYANRTAAFGARGRSGKAERARESNPFKALIKKGPGFPEEAPWRRRNQKPVAKRSSRVSGLAARYATALFELAEDDKALAELETDVGRFATMHDQSDDLRAFIRSPVYRAEEQVRAIAAVLDRAGVKGLVANFFKVVAANRRLFATPEIIAAFRKLVARHRGEVTAEITSAEPLSETHVAALKEALKASLGKDVTLDARVDPTLIGGLIVKVGSRMIDSSLKTKLSSLKLAMKGAG